MENAQFTDPQYVDANGVGGLNAAFGAVSGSIALLAAAGFIKPGLYQPELMTVTFSGLTATIGLPAPLAVVNASGVVAQAHGTAIGSDTQSYAVSFSGLVPGSGSIVAYCAAQAATVQQNPVPIPGPPPAHPSFNPNYQPTIGYAQAVDTLSLSTTTTAPDGMSTFELFRTTLTAGEGSITSWSTEYQQRTTPYWAQQPTTVSGGALTFPQAQGTLVPASGGITSTLPLAVSGTGLRYAFANTSTGTWTVVTQGSDKIYGGTPGSASGTASLVIPSQGACWIWGSGAEWLVVAANPTAVTEYYGQDTGSANVYAVAFPIPYVTRVPGTVLYVKIANANTGASTLTPGTGLGATIVQANGTSLVAGALVAGMIAAFVDNGTYYQLVNPAGVGQLAATQTWSGANTFTGAVVVPNATPGDANPVPIPQADLRYAALNGSAAQTFSVANATTATEAVALGQFSSSLTGTGWKKYPDSNSPTGYFIDQWFEVVTSSSGPVNAVYPIAFPNAFLSGVTSYNYLAGGSTEAFTAQLGTGGATTTSVPAACVNPSNALEAVSISIQVKGY